MPTERAKIGVFDGIHLPSYSPLMNQKNGIISDAFLISSLFESLGHDVEIIDLKTDQDSISAAREKVARNRIAVEQKEVLIAGNIVFEDSSVINHANELKIPTFCFTEQLPESVEPPIKIFEGFSRFGLYIVEYRSSNNGLINSVHQVVVDHFPHLHPTKSVQSRNRENGVK